MKGPDTRGTRLLIDPKVAGKFPDRSRYLLWLLLRRGVPAPLQNQEPRVGTGSFAPARSKAGLAPLAMPAVKAKKVSFDPSINSRARLVHAGDAAFTSSHCVRLFQNLPWQSLSQLAHPPPERCAEPRDVGVARFEVVPPRGVFPRARPKLSPRRQRLSAGEWHGNHPDSFIHSTPRKDGCEALQTIRPPFPRNGRSGLKG